MFGLKTEKILAMCIFPHLLIIQFIETEKVVEADNLVVLIENQLRSDNSDFSIPTFEKM